MHTQRWKVQWLSGSVLKNVATNILCLKPSACKDLNHMRYSLSYILQILHHILLPRILSTILAVYDSNLYIDGTHILRSKPTLSRDNSVACNYLQSFYNCSWQLNLIFIQCPILCCMLQMLILYKAILFILK